MTKCFPPFLLLLFLVACKKPTSQPEAPVSFPISASLKTAFEKDSVEAKLAIDNGNLGAAIGIYEHALLLAVDSLSSHHAKTAQLYHELGKIYHRSKEWKKATTYYQKAIDIRQSLLATQPNLSTELTKSYFNLSAVQQKLGLYLPALENILHCIEIEENIEPKDANLMAFIGGDYLEASKLYRELNDLENALRYQEQAMAIFQKDPVKYAGSLADAWNSAALIQVSLGSNEEAIEFFRKALAQLSILGNQLNVLKCLNNLGDIYIKTKDYPNAQIVLQQAAQLNEELLANAPNDTELLNARRSIFTNFSILHKRTKRFKEAIAESHESLRLAKAAWKTDYHPSIARCYDNLGNALQESGDVKQALQAYQQGITSIVPEFKETDIFKNPVLATANVSEKPFLLTLLTDKANALRLFAASSPDSLAYLRGAFNTWLSADTLLLQIRQSCREDGSKFHLSESAAPMYEQALSLTFDLWKRTGDTLYRNTALALCERNKAGVLLESLNDAQTGRANSASSPDKTGGTLSKIQSLRKAIAQKELAVFEAQKADSTAQLARTEKDSLFLLKSEVQRLEREFEKALPAWSHQKFALSQSPAPHELQRQLPPDAALLEYFLGDSTIFTVCLTKGSFHCYETALPSNFLEMAGQFHKAVSDWDFVQGNPTEAQQAYLATAPALYDLLLKKPLSALSAERIGRLVIVPDGALGYLPFEAMLASRAASWKEKNLPTVLRSFAVSYAYSAHFLKGKNRSFSNGGFAGFGLSYDERTLDAATAMSQNRRSDAPSVFDELRGAPGKLPYSTKEVEAIAKLTGGRAWLDTEATKANFLENAPDCGILHFAGHGFTDVEHPLNSALLFSKPNDSTDCFLRAADLYGLQLNASLTVLSACNTGSGELRKGEGIMSFARAFAGAGVPSVVMSLWSVTDASMASVMQRFYANLKNGNAKDVALREAKLEYLSAATPEHALPIYWAGAVLMGDASPIEVSGSVFSWKWLAIAAAIVAVAWGVKKKWSKR